MEYVPPGEMIGQSRRPSAAASSTVSIPTPSRDLSFRRGAYTHNILRLEQSAEEMSASGSDIGEEIRRLNDAGRSRQNSIQRSLDGNSTQDESETHRNHHVDLSGDSRSTTEGHFPHRSRKGSYANSILDLNSNARAGGYSPGEFITSPVGSVTSIHGKRVSTHRRTSTESRNSRLAHMIDSSFTERPMELGLGVYDFAGPSRQPSQSSYAQGDDRAALPLNRISVLGQANGNASYLDRSSVMSHATNTAQHSNHRPAMDEVTMTSTTSAVLVDGQDAANHDAITPPQRPGSTDTYQQAQTAFHDFDGVHCSSDMEEFIQLDQDGNEVRRISARRSSGTASLRAPSILLAPDQSHMSIGAPPPEAGMVYYPAPVPRMLNLPKRLSQLPAASAQAKRRTQAMSQMYAGTRNSAAWLSSGLADNKQATTDSARAPLNERLSVANYANVPPQLRASVFFEHQTVVHDVDVKSESAVATLDSILAASATAPVSAFTDHPYAGDISKTIFKPERLERRSTANDLRMSTALPLNKRQSNLSGLLKRASSNNVLDQQRYTMLDSQGENRKTLMSLAGAQNPEDLRMPLSGETLEEVENESDEELGVLEEQEDQDFIHDTDLNELGEDDDPDDNPMFIQPSTLLAELQVRKAQQKSRNRTAATAYPNGMHSTLLQLDAVAEIDKRKRQGQRVALAWEDPALKEDDAVQDAVDDDVPLGMLYPSKSGLIARKMGDNSDWDRPLGLMEKRQMEDNEPLSSRRSRLRGEPIQRPRPVQRPTITDRPATAQSGAEGELVDDETLAQRLRRISSSNALDAAISDVVPKDGSRPLSTFTDDVINQLNGGSDKANTEAMAPTEAEEETLGQRRARLQREKMAKNSMSNLLAANPVGERKASKEHVSQRGTLLYANEQAQAAHKRNMMASTMRASSFGPQAMAASRSTANLATPMAQPSYNTGMQTSASSPMFMQNGGYFAQPATMQNAGMQIGGYFSQPTTMQNGGYFAQPSMGYAPPVMQPAMMNPYTYGMLTGQTQPQMYSPHSGMQLQQAMHPAQMGYGFGMQPTMQQRSAIDQWRLNIAQ